MSKTSHPWGGLKMPPGGIPRLRTPLCRKPKWTECCMQFANGSEVSRPNSRSQKSLDA